MADEETNATEELVCACVRWHSPKGPVTIVGDTPVCLVTANAVDQLLAKYATKGKIVKADQRGFTKFQRELSEKLYADGVTTTQAAPEPEVAAEPEPEPELQPVPEPQAATPITES